MSPQPADGSPVKVLVTGSSGRLGRALRIRLDQGPEFAPAYLVSPHTVTATDVRVDVTDSVAVRAAVESLRPDVIVHLASLTGTDCERNPERAEDVNVGSVRTLTEAARELGVSRLVFTSSSAIYGDRYTRPVTEDTPPQPTSVYGDTKLRAEALLSGTGGVQTLALRIFNLFGDEFEESLIWRLLHSSAEQPVALRGPDNFVRDYVHVGDVADAITASLRVELSGNHETINVGSGVPLSNRDLLDLLGDRCELHYRVVDGQRSYSCADITRARQLLGFTPTRLT